MNNDEKYMNNALDEALKAHYHNWKDALVGCVIVKDDTLSLLDIKKLTVRHMQL